MNKERLIPLIVATALFMENMDSTVIATSLPAIAADIGTSPLTLKLAITSYLLSLAVFIPASGWTADRFGARMVFSLAIAVFMVGAYQETLGDLHNLFGDTHVVHVRLHDEGGWWIEEIVKGDTANKVLEYMEYDVAELYPALARDCERAIRDGRMTLAQSQALKRFYERELDGYAYLEPAGA